LAIELLKIDIQAVTVSLGVCLD